MSPMTESGAADDDATAAGDAPSVRAGELAGRILVADDERNIRRTLRMVLEGEGAEVLEAASGEETLALLDATTPPVEVLVIDVRMPGMSGLQVLEQLAARGGGRPSIPVILDRKSTRLNSSH